MIENLRFAYFKAHKVNLGGDKEDAGAVNDAFDILSDPDKKRAYDAQRAREPRAEATQRPPANPVRRSSPASSSGRAFSLALDEMNAANPGGSMFAPQEITYTEKDVPCWSYKPDLSQPMGVDIFNVWVPYYDKIRIINTNQPLELALTDEKHLRTYGMHISSAIVIGRVFHFNDLGGLICIPCNKPGLEIEIITANRLEGTVGHPGTIKAEEKIGYTHQMVLWIDGIDAIVETDPLYRETFTDSLNANNIAWHRVEGDKAYIPDPSKRSSGKVITISNGRAPIINIGRHDPTTKFC